MALVVGGVTGVASSGMPVVPPIVPSARLTLFVCPSGYVTEMGRETEAPLSVEETLLVPSVTDFRAPSLSNVTV